MKHLLVLLVTLLVSANVSAYDAYIDGIYYNLDANTQQATVTHKGEYSYSSMGSYSGSVTIPSSVAYAGVSYDVSRIGENAFYFCERLTSVTIPSSVTTIGKYAFECCKNLKSAAIPSSVTNIGDEAFSNCSSLLSINVDVDNVVYDSRDNCNAIIETATNTLIQGCNTTIIPNTITSIGNSSFDGCEGLTSVVIPEGVTTIGNRAFYNCRRLTSANIPSTVTIISNICTKPYIAAIRHRRAETLSGVFDCLSLENLSE